MAVRGAGGSSDPRSGGPEQAAARSAAAKLLRRHRELAAPAPTGEPVDPSSDDAWAHGAFVVPNTARLARAEVALDG